MFRLGSLRAGKFKPKKKITFTRLDKKQKPAAQGVTKAERYGENWDETREEALRRAGYKCTRCSWKPQNKEERRYLHVHHRHHVAKGGTLGSKELNRQKNLCVLCERCHSRSHGHATGQKRRRVSVAKKSKKQLKAFWARNR